MLLDSDLNMLDTVLLVFSGLRRTLVALGILHTAHRSS